MLLKLYTHIAEKDIYITKDPCSHLKVISLHQKKEARNKETDNYSILSETLYKSVKVLYKCIIYHSMSYCFNGNDFKSIELGLLPPRKGLNYLV